MFTVFQVDRDDSLEPFAYERARLADAGGELVVGGCTTEEELIEMAKGARVLWLAWKPGVTKTVLAALPTVELVVRWGVGFEQIDVAAATEMGVAVANAPSYGTHDVAEHVIALLMAGSRRIPWYQQQMIEGAWPPAMPGTMHRVSGRQIGIIGVGRIGAGVAQRAAGLGLDVVGYDEALTPEEITSRGARPVSLEQLLRTSDFVSLHVPLNASTGHLIGAAQVAQMKPGAALINASRGKVVDTDAVIEALNNGHLAWAGLDVFEQEPLPADATIRATRNVIMTPHVAGYSDESWQDLRSEMVRTTLDWVNSGWASTIVNPDVRSHLRVAQGN
ncbi:MAG: C-terminal binding protein [Actinomycetes bacterium]